MSSDTIKFTKELNRLLPTMDVPENRKTDIKWLQRNLGIRNCNHENFPMAIMIIEWLIKNKI